jgi:hypothetical protein
MVTSIELAEVRQLLSSDPERAVARLRDLEARLREEEEDFDGYCDRLDRERFERDAALVLDESARTGEACGIVRRRGGAA